MNDPTLYGHGWCPEPPSERDFTHEHDEVHALISETGLHAAMPEHLSARVDLRKWCSPVRFQGRYQTCQAHVVAGMLELIENRAFGQYVEVSRLFLYQVTRRLLQEEGAPGVYIRQMMGALSLLGVPPEKYWPYLETGTVVEPRGDDPRIDTEPDAFCFALARRYGALNYYRLDPADRPKTEVLHQIKAHVAAGLPTSLGFPMHLAALKLPATIKTGRIPYTEREDFVGNHAVLVVGYDDELEIESPDEPACSSKGAFLVKNSWSDKWGEKGYGWLPYAYLLENHAKDVWTMVEPKWLDTRAFDLDLKEVDVPAAPKSATKTSAAKSEP